MEEEQEENSNNSKLSMEAMMSQMEQMMITTLDAKLEAVRQQLQQNGEQMQGDHHLRRARRGDRNQQRQHRDEEAADYYSQSSHSSQDSQRKHRRAREGIAHQQDNMGGLKLRIPPFHGKNDPDTYLEWEKKTEFVFGCHQYSEINKVRTVAAEFYNYALSWWDQFVTSRKRYGEKPVETWTEMKAILRRRFVPNHPQRERHQKLRSDKPRHHKEYVSTLVSQPKQKSDVPKALEKKNVLSQDKLCKQKAKPAKASVQTKAKISSAPNKQAPPSKEAEPLAITLAKDKEQTQDTMQLTLLKSLQPEPHLNANMSNIEKRKTNLSSKHSQSEQHNVRNKLEHNSTKNFTV